MAAALGGKEVTGGRLYRLIRPTYDCWEQTVDGRKRPSPRAFRKDGDRGISMVIASETTYQKARESFSDYGICEILVERLQNIPPPDPRTVINPKKAPRMDRVWVELDHDPDVWGDDHVLVIGVTARLRDWIRDLAAVVHEPDELRDPIPEAPDP